MFRIRSVVRDPDHCLQVLTGAVTTREKMCGNICHLHKCLVYEENQNWQQVRNCSELGKLQFALPEAALPPCARRVMVVPCSAAACLAVSRFLATAGLFDDLSVNQNWQQVETAADWISCSLPGLRRPFRRVWRVMVVPCSATACLACVAVLGDRRPFRHFWELSCMAHPREGISRAGRQTRRLSVCRNWKETHLVDHRQHQKNVQGCVSQNSDPMNSTLRKAGELGLNASAGHTMKFSGRTGTKLKFGKEKGNLEALSKKVNLMSEIVARAVLRNEHLRKPHDNKIVPAKQRGIWREKYTSSKPKIKLRFFSCENKRRHVDSGASMHNAHTEQERFKLRGANKRESTKRESTSFCS